MRLVNKMFSKDKNNRKRNFYIEDVDSHRGLGRSAAVGLLTGKATGVIPSLVGGYAGKKYAEELEKEGASDSEVIVGAGRRGAAVGGGTALGAIGLRAISKEGRAKLAKNPKLTALGVTGSALGGALGARKSARTRIDKRDLKEYKKEHRDYR